MDPLPPSLSSSGLLGPDYSRQNVQRRWRWSVYQWREWREWRALQRGRRCRRLDQWWQRRGSLWLGGGGSSGPKPAGTSDFGGGGGGAGSSGNPGAGGFGGGNGSGPSSGSGGRRRHWWRNFRSRRWHVEAGGLTQHIRWLMAVVLSLNSLAALIAT